MLVLKQQFQRDVFKTAVLVIKKKLTAFYWNDHCQFPIITFLFLLLLCQHKHCHTYWDTPKNGILSSPFLMDIWQRILRIGGS